MTKPDPSLPGSTENLAYANLVERLSETLRAGQKIDWSDIALCYPHWVEELKEELQTIQTLLDAGNITSSDLSADDLITGKMPEIDGYQLLRRLGAGGMGIVYEAIEMSLQRHVAIKVLSAQLRPNSRVRVRFENEATAAGRLNHPNILTVYKIGESAGLMFYVMPYVDGQTLSELASTTDKSYESIASIIYQTALALDHAHESGIFHRDVKPSNIMLDRHGHVWLLDFGLASLDEQLDLTQTGEIIGTLRYMSPERLAPKTTRTLDRRLDVYSLGATLYELLAGLPPYHDIAKPALSKAIQESAPTALRQLCPNAPLPLIRICEKAMEREPADRYSNCLELAEDLQRFVAGKDVQARPLPPSKRIGRYIRRHTVTLLAAASFSILLLTGSLVMLQRSRAIERQKSTIEYQNKLVDLQAEDLRRKSFYLELTKLRENRDNGEVGWRSDQLKVLKRLASAELSSEELSFLKKEWIATSRAVDILETKVLLEDRMVFRCEWNKSGTQLVAGMSMSDPHEPMLICYGGEDLHSTFEVNLPRPMELGVSDETNDGVRSLCFSKDQQRLWVGTRRGLVHEVDLENGRVLRSKACHLASIFGLVVKEDSGELITGASDNSVVIWDLNSLQEKQRLETVQPVRSFVLLGENLFVLEGTLKQHKRDQGKWSSPIDSGIVLDELSSALSEDGDLLHCFSQKGINVLSRESKEVTRTFSFTANQSNPRLTNAHKVAQCDGDLLLTTDSNGLMVWNQVNGAQWGSLSIANNENAGVSLKPNSQKIAVWGLRKLSIYDIHRSDIWGATPARSYPVDDFQLLEGMENGFSGVLISTRSIRKGMQAEEQEVSFQPWDKRKRSFSQVCGQGPVDLVGVNDRGVISHHANGDYFMWSGWNHNDSDNRVEVENDAELRSLHDAGKNIVYCSYRLRSPELVARVRFIPELVAIDGSDRNVLWSYKPFKSHDTDTSFTIKSILASGDRVYLACDDQYIRELDAKNGEELRKFFVGDHVCVSMCMLGMQHIAIGSAEGHLLIIDLESGRLHVQRKLHQNRVNTIQAIYNEYLVSGGLDGDLLISSWDGQELTEVLRVPHRNVAIDRIQVTSDGNRICYLCRSEYSVRYLDWKKLLDELKDLSSLEIQKHN